MYFNENRDAKNEENAQNINLKKDEKENKTYENTFLSKFKGMFQNNIGQYRHLINKWVKGDETKLPQHKRSLSMSTVQTYQNEEPYYGFDNGEHSKQVLKDKYLNQVSIDGGHSSEEPSIQALCDRKIKLIRQLIELRQLTGYLYRSRSIQGHVLTAVTMTMPTWCDHCGLSVGDQSCLQCSFCSITCHAKCSPHLAFQCTSSAPNNNQLNESHDHHVTQRTNSNIDLSFNKSYQPIKCQQKTNHMNYNMSEYNLNKISINIDNYKINKRDEGSLRGIANNVSYNAHNGNRCRRSLSAGHRELTMYNDDYYDDYYDDCYDDDDEDSDYDDLYVHNDEDGYYDEEGDDGTCDGNNEEYYEDNDDHKNDDDDDEEEEEEEDYTDDESDDNDDFNYDEGNDYEDVITSYELRPRRDQNHHTYSRKGLKKGGRFIPQLPPPPTLFPIPSLNQQLQKHPTNCFRNQNNSTYHGQYSGNSKRMKSSDQYQPNPHRSRRLDRDSNIQISHNSFHMQYHRHVHHHHHHYHHHRSVDNDTSADTHISSNVVSSVCDDESAFKNEEVSINSGSSNYKRNISNNSDSGIFSYDSSSPKINIDNRKSATRKNDIDNNEIMRKKEKNITSNDIKGVETKNKCNADNNHNSNNKNNDINTNSLNKNNNDNNNRKSIYERLNWEFEEKVKYFNSHNKLGLVFNLTSTSLEGSIRVHMNLLQPIKMLLSAPPILTADQSKTSKDTSNKNGTDPIKCESKAEVPVNASFPTSKSDHTELKSFDQQNEHSKNNDQIEESIFSSPTHKYHKICTQREVRSFKLPSGTSKLIYINDTTTTEQVIGLLLNKFCIVNNPRHFSLYQQTSIHGGVCTLRKLQNNELPLLLCLHWFQLGEEHLDNNKLILQEKDPGGIAWEHFQLTELNNFLKMLNKEEKERIDFTRNKYRVLKLHIKRRQREITNQTNSVDNLTDVMVQECIKPADNSEDIGNKTS